MIYVARNLKDTCVSCYHHCRAFMGYKGTMESFAEQFITDNVMYAPYWTHLREFWNKRDRPDILFLKYEDMKRDLPAVIQKTAAFIGKTISSGDTQRLAEHLSFDNMKTNPSVNYEFLIGVLRGVQLHENVNHQFIRKGQVDGWKEELSPGILAKMDKWIEKNHIDGLY